TSLRSVLHAGEIGNAQMAPRTCDPKLFRLFAAAANASASISASITFMPASANAQPSANPMPLAPPVTNAVLPASSRMLSLAPFNATRRHCIPQETTTDVVASQELSPTLTLRLDHKSVENRAPLGLVSSPSVVRIVPRAARCSTRATGAPLAAQR